MASNQPAYAPAPARGATGTTDEPGTDGRGFQPFGPYEAAPQAEFAAVPQPEFAPAPGLAPQAPYLPGPAVAPQPAFGAGPQPELAPQPQPEFVPQSQAESAPAPQPGSTAQSTPQSTQDAEPQQPRLPRQRNVARGGTVLGIAAMAAVGAAGVAAAAAPLAPAAGAGAVPVSAPDRAFEPEPLPPYAEVPAATRPAEEAQPAPAPAAAEAGTEAPAGTPVDPGEALRTRIIGQATAQREAVAQAERHAAAQAAAAQAAREAAAQKVREQAAAAKAAAQAQAKADAEAAARAEAERLEQLAASYIKPVASYTLTNAFGEADPWANLHTGQDFTAPTGTPVHAVHSGTVTSAGWAGAYGYRVVLTLDDGTQLWYCHLSTMVVTEGPVTTGETIGRVGATGNVPAPHLHLEVRPGGAAPVDPVPWLQAHDVAV